MIRSFKQKGCLVVGTCSVRQCRRCQLINLSIITLIETTSLARNRPFCTAELVGHGEALDAAVQQLQTYAKCHCQLTALEPKDTVVD